jgi:hypothetical protein
MHSLARYVCASLVALAVAAPALAQEQEPQTPPAPPEAVAVPGAKTQYVAPLYQTTQGTYVPQSVAISGPRLIKDWDESRPIPDGYHPELRNRVGLITGGAILFAVPYLFSALSGAVAADSNRWYGGGNPAAAMYVPIVGPIIQIGHSDSAALDFVLVLDALAQAGGFAMLIGGLASPKKVLVRNDLGTLGVAPLMLPSGGGGMAVHGTFF